MGVDAIGLIPEGGGIARVVGHELGYVGAVADHAGSKLISAVGNTAGVALVDPFDTSPTARLSGLLALAGFVPVLGQLAAGASFIIDLSNTITAIAACH